MHVVVGIVGDILLGRGGQGFKREFDIVGGGGGGRGEVEEGGVPCKNLGIVLEANLRENKRSRKSRGVHGGGSGGHKVWVSWGSPGWSRWGRPGVGEEKMDKRGGRV